MGEQVPLYAHTPNEQGEWHSLVDHLQAVALLAAQFASRFGMEDLGRLSGAWHDIGKATADFQAYLQRCHLNPGVRQKGPPHSIFGAVWAAENAREPLSLILAGHHGGLPALAELKNSRLAPALNSERMKIELERIREHLELSNSTDPLPELDDALSAELIIRMLFSALVDADFLDTEAHFRRGIAQLRVPQKEIGECWSQLAAAQAKLSGQKTDAVNRARHEIYEACLRSATGEQGFYRLTVPTGGGKTLSSMAFALRHAITHNLERVIVAIPYTSIIDQNADVYARVLGAEAVLAHHSAAQWLRSDDQENEPEACVRWRLASENWDCPVVVTTTVQLFESLFANRVSACRKLHRIARSVLILDEVQTLPERLLAPILDMLRHLVRDYNVTVVFCTATQPAFEAIPTFHTLQGTVREIVPDPARYFRELRRVNYECPLEAWDWGRVAEEVRREDQCLVVVNRKADALALLDELAGARALHLSTSLYPAHRRRVLTAIRGRLNRGETCRVVSTQVIEAGVDLDFAVVLRAVGPLDRIVQAAGRCNREGTRPRPGRVVIFRPVDGGTPRGAYASATQTAGVLLQEDGLDLHDPAVYRRYFQRLYQTVEDDSAGIQDLRRSFDYPGVAERFRLIPDATTQAVVRTGVSEEDRREVATLMEELDRHRGSERRILRQLEQYAVALYERDALRALAAGLAVQRTNGLLEWHGIYDEIRGLTWAPREPADLIW